MSALFTTIVIFTIGVLCSTEGAVITPGSNVVDIPGFSHGLGRCKAMMECVGLALQLDESGIISRAVCTVEDCHKLCLKKTCKAFEFYEKPGVMATEKFCTIYPTVKDGQEGYCEGPLVKDTSHTAHIVTYIRTGNSSNPTSFFTNVAEHCNRSLTRHRSMELVPRQCQCCAALKWAAEEVERRFDDKLKAEQSGLQGNSEYEIASGSVLRRTSTMSIRPNVNNTVNVDVTSHFVINHICPNPAEARLKSSYTEKKAVYEASLVFANIVAAACGDHGCNVNQGPEISLSSPEEKAVFG